MSASTSPIVWSKPRTDTCETLLPTSLKALLSKKYPEYRVVDLSMLLDLHQSFYLKDHKKGCPGVTKVHFFDKSKIDYAVVLAKGTRPNVLAHLILAKEGVGTAWEITMLESEINGTPAVMTLPPDKYTGDFEEGVRTLDARHEAIFLVGYESWSIVYALTEQGIQYVQLSD